MKAKNIAGAALLVLSIGGIILWEGFGRVKVTRTPVLCASSDITKGAVITEELIELKSVDDGDVISGACGEGCEGLILGKRASFNMKKGQQLSENYVTANEDIPDGSYFQIPSSWIYSRSSAMRKGDRISFYLMPEKTYLGSYTAAFVKDGNESEITDGGIISHVEIECTRSEYFRLYDIVSEKGEGRLLLVIDREGKF